MASSKIKSYQRTDFLGEAVNVVQNLRLTPENKNNFFDADTDTNPTTDQQNTIIHEADSNLCISIPSFRLKDPNPTANAQTNAPSTPTMSNSTMSPRVASALMILASSNEPPKYSPLTTEQFLQSIQRATTKYLECLIDKSQSSRNIAHGCLSWIRHNTLGDSGKKRAQIIQNWSLTNAKGLINHIEFLFNKYPWNHHSLNTYLADQLSEILRKEKSTIYTTQERRDLIDTMKNKLQKDQPTLQP